MSTLSVNINNVSGIRRDYPAWNTRARIRKVDEAGNVLQGQYAYGGEAVRVSPRYQKGGTNYRVRPEKPAAFFAAWAFENGLLPTALTAEEAESQAGLAILEPMWESYKSYFPKLESPFAACDQGTEPSLKVGFSFNIYQVLVEQIGMAKSTTNGATRSLVAPAGGNGAVLDSLKTQIAAMRARSTPLGGLSELLPPSAKAKK